MATSLFVPVTRIGRVQEHPNASMLGIAQVLGYQVVTGFVEDENGPISRNFLKGQYDEKGKRIPIEYIPDCGWVIKDRDGNATMVAGDQPVECVHFNFQNKEGDLVVYFPADTVIPDEWAEKFGVKTLLRSGNRVAKIALRGEPSFGLVVGLPEGVDWQEGDNVADYYSAQKYEPPIKTTAGDAAPHNSEIDPYFDKFTDIQNGRLYSSVFQKGERVVMSEKLHGTNCRVGILNGHRVAGSMELRRSPPADMDFSKSTYWFPWSIPGVDALLTELSKTHRVVELFGEVYGNSIQRGFVYDAGMGIGFRSFGIKADDKFLDWDDFTSKCMHFNIPMVPVLYDGPFDLEKMMPILEEYTTLGNAPVMEGGVVVPVPERHDPKVGRAALKYISYQYDLLKNKPDCKDI